jgi:hypothetical protein
MQMRRGGSLFSAGASLGVALVSFFVACDWHSSISTTVVPGSGAPQPREGFSPVVCGAADIPSLTGAVYVSPQGTDGPGCGASSASACKTIQQGVANCGGAGCGVLVLWGVYKTAEAAPPLPDRIALRDGVHIYGGCRFEGEADEKYRTIVQAPDDGEPALVANAITLGCPAWPMLCGALEQRHQPRHQRPESILRGGCQFRSEGGENL